MKQYLFILVFALCSLFLVPVKAQVVTPVKWSGERVGDSVRLTATIDEGWHMTLISLGEEMIGEEYEGMYSVTLAEAVPVRYNACDDKMCTAPEVWEYRSLESGIRNQDENANTRSLWVIFLLAPCACECQ